jgi:hypothetical protein
MILIEKIFITFLFIFNFIYNFLIIYFNKKNKIYLK